MNLVAPRRQPVFDGRVLFERETLLSALRACLTEAGAGHGRLVALSGEAGIGKSSLVRRLIEDSSGVRVLIGVCDGVLPARPMGPLDDVADALGRQFEGWHHRSPDRLDLFRGFRSVLSDRLTLLVVEDVHWADQATLDFLRYLGRRLEQLPLLVVLTYRSDAVGANHPLTSVQREWPRRGLPVPRGPRPVNGDAQGLTAQELEVPELLGEGLRNSEIADRLVLSEKTVAHHVSAVLRKLAVPTRARATSRARQLGIPTTSTDPASWAARPM